MFSSDLRTNYYYSTDYSLTLKKSGIDLNCFSIFVVSICCWNAEINSGKRCLFEVFEYYFLHLDSCCELLVLTFLATIGRPECLTGAGRRGFSAITAA